MLLENEPGVIGGIFQFCDDRPFDRDIEALEHVSNQVMRQRPFLGRVPQEHANDCSHIVLDLDDEDFFFVTDENGATAVGRQDPPNIDGHDIILHIHSLLPPRQKTSPAFVSAKFFMGFAGWR